MLITPLPRRRLRFFATHTPCRHAPPLRCCCCHFVADAADDAGARYLLSALRYDADAADARRCWRWLRHMFTVATPAATAMFALLDTLARCRLLSGHAA